MIDVFKINREITKANKRIAVIKGQRSAMVKTCNALARAMKENHIGVMQRKNTVDILCLVDEGLGKELDELKHKINMWHLDLHQAQDNTMEGYAYD